MRRLIAFALVLCSASLLPAEIKYRIFKGEKVAGYARIDQKLTEDGGKYVQVVLRLKQGSQNLVITSQSTFDKLGAPVRILQSITPEGKPPTILKIANFTQGEATVVVRQRSVARTVHVSLESATTPNNAAEFWFLRGIPDENTTCEASTFNMDSLEWETSRSRFVGMAPGGYHVKITRGSHEVDAVMDGVDLPVTLNDSTGYRFVRL